MTKYRPEGWDNPEPCGECSFSEKLSCGGVCNESIRYSSKEAGADAILEGLRKQPINMKIVRDFDKVTMYILPPESGYLVFIPEEVVGVGGEIVNVGDGDRPPTVTTKGPDGNSD